MLRLWIEEGLEEAEEEMKKKPQQKQKEQTTGCACGRAVCCGKHKGGHCSCGNHQKERS